jgi:hypothetical protein
MQVTCNRPGCLFCAGDTSQLYCEGCHAPLGPFEPGKLTVCDTCLAVRQRTRANGYQCRCPAGERRETIVKKDGKEMLGCARCMGIIRELGTEQPRRRPYKT